MKTAAAAVYRINYPVGPDRVWAALREPKQVAQWFGWDYPGLAEEIQTIFVDGADGVEATKTLHLGLHDMHVRPWGEGCMVELHHAEAQETPDAAAWAAMLPEIDEGWISFLQQLRFWLTEAPEGLRQAPHVNGMALESDGRPVWEKLGLEGLDAHEPGSRVQGEWPWGEAFEGTLFFRSPLQAALSIPAWGPGLLLLAHAPDPTHPWDDASATLLTYGQDAAWVKALEAKWSTWWQAHHS